MHFTCTNLIRNVEEQWRRQVRRGGAGGGGHWQRVSAKETERLRNKVLFMVY